MNQPKVSLNQIGEYLEANPARRKKIVQEAKYPKKFITARYSTAKKIIRQYILSDYDNTLLTHSIDKLEKKKTDKPFQEQDRILSLELLRGLQSSILPNLDGLTINIVEGKLPKTNISGIQININPDFIIRGKYRGKKVVGGIKLSIAKRRVISKNSADTITVLLKDKMGLAFMNICAKKK